MDPVITTLIVLVIAIIAFVSNRVPLEIVAVGVALALWATGILTLPEALSGFGDPTVIFIATLFIVSESLDSSGVMAWAGQWVIGRAGTKRSKIVVVISLLVAVVSAFISINGAVAALLPLVVVVAARAGIAASKLLIPLAFAASAGSMLTLTGTPVNIVVSDLAASSGGRAFGYFEFALVGIPLLMGTIAIVLLLGPRLLPDRPAVAVPVDLVRHARLLRSHYEVTLDTAAIINATDGVSEIVVPPRSPLIGQRVAPGMAVPGEALVVLAVRRGDDVIKDKEVIVRAGDALLMQGTWDELVRNSEQPGVLSVDPPRALRRSVPLGRGARRALLVLAGMVVLLATGWVPPAVAGLLAVGMLILTRTITFPQAYRSVSWTTVVLIAGMMPLAAAVTVTGTADLVADSLISWLGGANPYLSLLVLCLLTLVLGQLISNMATVLIVAPIAVALAGILDLSVMPYMMALTVAGAAAFFTPIATPANLMVMEPGGYRFGDYWKLGLPLAIFFIAMAVLYVPLIWPF
ncbi:SLC13 family permease [Microbacterium marmarense]|uniref:SLC13 family permease n=1 Tax=Microbacterium marmarense TaxID=3122051 RepID=A0ABU8LQR1_9MICO